MTLYPAKIFVVAMLCGIGPTANSQENTSSYDNVLVGVSLGYNAGLTRFAPIVSADLTWHLDKHVFTLQFFHTQEMYRFGGEYDAAILNEQITGLGLMCGRSFSFQLGRPLFPLFPIPLLVRKVTDYRISSSIGLSVNRAHVPNRNELGIGLPLQFEFVQILTPSVAYVHRIYVNINGVKSIWSGSWAVQISL